MVERFGFTPRMDEPVTPIQRHLDEVFVRYSDYEKFAIHAAGQHATLSARVAQLEEALRVAAAFISEEAEYRGSMDKDYTTPAVPLLQKIQTALSEKEARG